MSDQSSPQDDKNSKKEITEEIPQVDSKSRKDEILSAYQELVKKFQDKAEGSEQRKKEVKQQKADVVVSLASQFTLERVQESAQQLEQGIKQWLDSLHKSLTSEIEKLKSVQEAHEIEKTRLSEVHDITVEADTLAQLILAHKDKKQQLEEMYGKRSAEIEQSISSQKEAWKREQEEYLYELGMRRKKEEAEYEEERAKREEEIHRRELRLKEQEQELNDLRKRTQVFEEELETKLIAAGEDAELKVRAEEHTKAKILAEQNAADKKIMEHSLSTLRQRLLEEQTLVARLQEELSEANRGVKDIAISVIESGSRKENPRSLNEYMKKESSEEVKEKERA